MASDPWKDESGKESCPECGGFGYHDDGSEEGVDCGTCHGTGVAERDKGDEYISNRGDE